MRSADLRRKEMQLCRGSFRGVLADGDPAAVEDGGSGISALEVDRDGDLTEEAPSVDTTGGAPAAGKGGGVQFAGGGKPWINIDCR